MNNKEDILVECPICKKTKSIIVTSVWDFRFNLGQMNVYRKCDNCNTIFLFPVSEDLSKEYPDSYSQWFVRERFTLIRKILGIERKRFDISKKTWKKIKNQKIKKSKNILDVGAGAGILLSTFKRMGFNVWAMEWSPIAIKNLQNKGFNTFSVLEIEKLATEYENHFDFITIHHVLEHVPNPIELLSNLKKLLKPKGELIIVVPRIDCWAFYKYEEFYNHLDGGRHVIMYSPSTLINATNQSGLQLTRYETRANSNTIIRSWMRSKGYKKLKNNKVIIPVLKFLLFPITFWISITGKGELLEVVLKKNLPN